MKFVIQGLKYDTDKMKKIANVKKWYKTNSPLVKAIYGNRETQPFTYTPVWLKRARSRKASHKKESEGTKHENYLHTKPKGRMCQDHNGGQYGGIISNRV